MKNLTNAATAHTHTHRFSFLIALLCIFTISFTSCGDGDDPVTPDPVKTLDKTKILNKKWYIKDETGWTHYFYPDGKYHDNGGTWKWLGDEKSHKKNKKTNLRHL